jgi:uncharacterized protein YegL
MANTPNKATSTTPQIVILVMDDSGSMEEVVPGGGVKAKMASEGIRQVVMEMQAVNVGGRGSRFYVSLLKFGDHAAVMAEAEPPSGIKLRTINFEGKSGGTDMAAALKAVADVLGRSLTKVRQIQGYREKDSPAPLVLFFSDGENTGGAVDAVSRQIRQVPFEGGAVQVVAVGIGMRQEHFAVMKGIASSPELAVNLDPAALPQFLADVGTTFFDSSASVGAVVGGYRR